MWYTIGTRGYYCSQQNYQTRRSGFDHGCSLWRTHEGRIYWLVCLCLARRRKIYSTNCTLALPSGRTVEGALSTRVSRAPTIAWQEQLCWNWVYRQFRLLYSTLNFLLGTCVKSQATKLLSILTAATRHSPLSSPSYGGWRPGCRLPLFARIAFRCRLLPRRVLGLCSHRLPLLQCWRCITLRCLLLNVLFLHLRK